MEAEMQSLQNIPSFLNSQAFISARFKEISALKNLINESSRVTSIFQRLPKHMRRRAMSHTIKRVPRNLRDAHRRQLEKNKALKVQKRSRKHFRKRPQNLLLEYNRRQKNNLWLETHIWHAKRFRMVSKWGYRLADRSCDKTFRASYRATSTHCLIQDVSYFTCMEINGQQQILLDGFKHITSSDCGLTIGAKCWLEGNREGKVTIFHKDSYPHDVIGDITFIWKPGNPNSMEFRTLWIWCHPSYYNELRQELIDLFDLEFKPIVEDVEMKDQSQVPIKKKIRISKKQRNVEQTKIAAKNIPHTKLPEYTNQQSNVRLILLKDTLNRFRLTGPLSNAVLINALHPAELFDKYLLDSRTNTWWTEHRASTDPIAMKLLDEFSSPSCFPPHAILGGHVIDPRLFLKRSRSKAVGNDQVSEPCTTVTLSAPKSAIWDVNIRDDISQNKFSSAQINKLRTNLLIPGHDEQLIKSINTVIPLLLVQRPGSTNSSVKLGYGSGWDIIIPANWAVPIWLSLILCGAKPGALRETKTLHFESKKMPELPPDSKAGCEYYQEIGSTDRDRYFRAPPNKRTNYIKNGFPTPFHYPWDVLINEWTTAQPEPSFYVLRNRQTLLTLKSHFENVKNKPKINLKNDLATLSSEKCLVPISIHLLNKGQLTPFSHIYLPKDSDLLNKPLVQYSGPLEPKHSDANKRKRRLFRKEHSKILKRLRRQRIKQNKTSVKQLPLKITKRKHSPTEEIVQKYLTEMKDLWIPPVCTSMRNHCTRELCGFIVTSGFSFMESRIVGQGYITLQSLFVLNDLWQRLKSEALLLTRSSNSLNYRYGLLKICV